MEELTTITPISFTIPVMTTYKCYLSDEDAAVVHALAAQLLEEEPETYMGSYTSATEDAIIILYRAGRIDIYNGANEIDTIEYAVRNIEFGDNY